MISTRGDFTHRLHLGMSGGNFGSHNLGVCYWVEARNMLNILQQAEQLVQERITGQMCQ